MTLRESIRRILMKLLFLYPYRVTTSSSLDYLRSLGFQPGENFSMQQGCIIDDSHCWMINVGNDVTLAPNVHILAHDASTKRIVGYTKVQTVHIGNNVFIGAGSIVLPGADIGDNCVIGAGSVVTGMIPPNSVAVGAPARVIKSFDTYREEICCAFEKAKEQAAVYDASYTVHGGGTVSSREEMKRHDGVLFVE